MAVHSETAPVLGEPLCTDCYDYAGHVLCNWHAPELWRRFTISLRRVLARRLGLRAVELARLVRVSFAKVAEYQRRGAVHFHALIRLDAPGDSFAPPHIPVTADELADAVREAASLVRLVVDAPCGGLVLRFGEQNDAQPIGGGPAGELTPEHVAAYLAKYATKSAEDFGVGDRRISPEAIPVLGVSDHVARIIRAAWQLGEREDYAAVRRWLHMLGFRGHFATKSRRYSTTLGAIRAERRDYRRHTDPAGARLLGDEDQDETTVVIGRWKFAGLGYLTGGDAALALSAAARARERRQTAREEAA